MSAIPIDPAAARFAALHRQRPGFVMPNAWDAGSARLLEAAGFEAIATTSAGIAFSLGLPDYTSSAGSRRVSRTRMFERIGEVVEAVSLPVNGDLEAGYGDQPAHVAETIRLAMDAGLAGANIEDKVPGEDRLYDADLAVERIRAAREAIDARDRPFVLTARCDAIAGEGLGAAIERCNRYREAGADCLFTPGTAEIGAIGQLVREIKGPLNMVLGLGSTRGNAYQWLAAGVQRVSIGGSIARAALGLVRRAARELRAEGTVTFADGQMAQAELNALFAQGGRRGTSSLKCR